MGCVKFTEQVGDISKTYEFGSYEDFKDWENKVSDVVVSAPEVDEEGWIENTGEKPSLQSNTIVEVKFNDGTTSKDTVNTWYWPLSTEDDEFEGTITHYRVVSK